jgi:hypothetical protein
MNVHMAVSTIQSRLNTQAVSNAGPHFVNIQKLFSTVYFSRPVGSYRVGFIVLGVPDKGSMNSFRSTVYINHDSNSKVSNQ